VKDGREESKISSKEEQSVFSFYPGPLFLFPYTTQ